MALAVLLQIFSCDSDSVIKITVRIRAYYRRHLLSSQEVRETGALCNCHDSPGTLRNLNACKLRNLAAGLSYRVSVRLAVIEESSPYLFKLLRIPYNIAAVGLEFLEEVFEILLRTDYRLLCGADDAVVIGTTLDNLRNSLFIVVAFVYYALHVSGAYSQSRTA